MTKLELLYKQQQRNYARYGLVYDDNKTKGRSWVGGQKAKIILERTRQQINTRRKG